MSRAVRRAAPGADQRSRRLTRAPSASTLVSRVALGTRRVRSADASTETARWSSISGRRGGAQFCSLVVIASLVLSRSTRAATASSHRSATLAREAMPAGAVGRRLGASTRCATRREGITGYGSLKDENAQAQEARSRSCEGQRSAERAVGSRGGRAREAPRSPDDRGRDRCGRAGRQRGTGQLRAHRRRSTRAARTVSTSVNPSSRATGSSARSRRRPTHAGDGDAHRQPGIRRRGPAREQQRAGHRGGEDG